jgi:hypothetical protein
MRRCWSNPGSRFEKTTFDYTPAVIHRGFVSFITNQIERRLSRRFALTTVARKNCSGIYIGRPAIHFWIKT